MIGTDPTTGQSTQGIAHLKIRVRDILTTRIGERVMRREYGSQLPELVDQPVNKGWLVEAYAAVAEALDRWEPELRLIRTRVDSVDEGHISLSITCEYLPEGRVVTLDGIVI
jgi:uncharacterized protein